MITSIRARLCFFLIFHTFKSIPLEQRQKQTDKDAIDTWGHLQNYIYICTFGPLIFRHVNNSQRDHLV